MMKSVLESVEPVIQQAEHVRINQKGLEAFCSCFKGLDQPFIFPFTPIGLNLDDKIQLDLAYNSVNFCYWGEPKWAIEYQGNSIGGAYGMKAAFHRALEEGFLLTRADYLEQISEQDFAHITRGNTEIPLLKERIQFLRQLGLILSEKYGGKAMNLVNSAGEDALKLLEELTANFPCYSDTAQYKGKEVLFHKRAQLFVSNTHNTLKRQGRGLVREDKLTGLADYKVPQTLRERNVFVYDEQLAQKVDGKQIIPAGCPEEVEIRASTIWAIELMVKNLKPRFPGLTAISLDRFLYLEAKKLSPESKPHHRAISTAH